MTSAYGHPVPVPAGVALAQRFGADIVPLELQGPAELGAAHVRFIATMHALIAWVQAHPYLPAPWSIAISIDVDNVASLEQVAAQLGVDAYRRDGVPQQVTVFDPLGPDGEFYTPIAIAVRTPDRPL